MGTGGNCIDILDTIDEINLTCPARDGFVGYQCLGFLDDSPESWGKEICGLKVLGPLSAAAEFHGVSFVNGIGSQRNFTRKDAIIDRTGLPLERFERIVHPTASVSRMSTLGPGTVILQNVTVASNARIGAHVIVLPNSVISHDSVVGDYTCIAGGVCISGGVTIGPSCYLGTNSSIIEQVTIGDYSLVGMGSAVLRDVAAGSVVVGTPARFLRHTRSAGALPGESAPSNRETRA